MEMAKEDARRVPLPSDLFKVRNIYLINKVGLLKLSTFILQVLFFLFL